MNKGEEQLTRYRELFNKVEPEKVVDELEKMQDASLFNFQCTQRILSIVEEILKILKNGKV